MRSDDPALAVEQPEMPEALRNTTFAERAAAREAKAKATKTAKATKATGNKAVREAEDK